MGVILGDSSLQWLDPAKSNTISINTYDDFKRTGFGWWNWNNTLEMQTPGPTLVPVLNCDVPFIGLTSPGRITNGNTSVKVTGVSSCIDVGLDWIYTVYFQAADSSYVESQCDTATMFGDSTTLYSLKVQLPATTPTVGWNCFPWCNDKNDSIGYIGKITLTVANGTSWLSTSQPFIYMTPATTQKIPLNPGWSAVSFNIIPENDTTTQVFGTEPNGFIFVKNIVGEAYIPVMQIDGIGHAQLGQGYLVYTTMPDTLKVQGIPINYAGTPISLSGWNLIAYLPPTNDSIVHALAGVASAIVVVKNDSGNVYWPSKGIDNIEIMSVGQGYQVYTATKASLTYPTPLSKAAAQTQATLATAAASSPAVPATSSSAANSVTTFCHKPMIHLPKTRHFATHAVTGNNATFLASKVTLGGKLVPDSSEIGAFDVPAVAGVAQQAVEISVYDLKGCLVKQLASGKYTAGHYEIAWNRNEVREAAAGSSVYIVRMKAANFDKRLRLVRVR